jgi:hypothetical protein
MVKQQLLPRCRATGATGRLLETGPCPLAWCKSIVGHYALRRVCSVCQSVTAGKLTMELSLNGAMHSSMMYRAHCISHSPFCSSRIASTRRVIAASLGSRGWRQPPRPPHAGKKLDCAKEKVWYFR